jgi:hypothetical protein
VDNGFSINILGVVSAKANGDFPVMALTLVLLVFLVLRLAYRRR